MFSEGALIHIPDGKIFGGKTSRQASGLLIYSAAKMVFREIAGTGQAMRVESSPVCFRVVVFADGIFNILRRAGAMSPQPAEDPDRS